MVLVLMVAAGGFLGGFLRWLLSQLLPAKPATFSANMLACGVAGMILISNFSELENALFFTGFAGPCPPGPLWPGSWGSCARRNVGARPSAMLQPPFPWVWWLCWRDIWDGCCSST